MSINLETKPQITVDISKVVEAYLRYLFKTPPHQKEIIISRRYPEGKSIYSKVMPVEYPAKRPMMSNPVTFILPLTKQNKHVLSFRYYTISVMAQEQLNDDLDVLFHIWLNDKFDTGYKIKSWSQELIISTILRGLNLRENAANFETIKKYDYRKQCRDEKKRFADLVSLELSTR